MSDLWVVLEGRDQLGAALRLLGVDGAGVTAVVVGDRGLAEHVSQYTSEVRWIDSGDSPVEAWTDAVATMVAVASPALVAGAATPGGRALMGGVAAAQRASLLSGVVAAQRDEGGVLVQKSDLEGRIVVSLRLRSPACVLAEPSDVEAPVLGSRGAVVQVSAQPGGIIRRSVEADPNSNSPLRGAARVVSVGWGLGAKESLGEVAALAEALDAEIACSMPVQEAGWLSTDRCVGLSTQRIAPELYLALGISGAPQHIAGIRRAGTVVAVNTDSKAPIFKIAAFGIVGDLHQIVPALTAALE